MRNPNRIKPILDLIEHLWMCYPDWRFWQLIMNLSSMFQDVANAKGKKIHDFWFVEDDEALEILQQLVEQNEMYGGKQHESNPEK